MYVCMYVYAYTHTYMYVCMCAMVSYQSRESARACDRVHIHIIYIYISNPQCLTIQESRQEHLRHDQVPPLAWDDDQARGSVHMYVCMYVCM